MDKGLISNEFIYNYTVAEGFDKANGKFPNTLGNAALVDCHSLGKKTASNIYKLADDVEQKTIYFLLAPLIREFADQIKITDFC